ncbi:hypothetical protein [Halocalculus aciditolerans]|uniref:hypothetical protein n=1 Tax=Halocalculus aciditolerans TaxID=1383812 RepID=UPI0016681E33|nr:hypothetical protein [Halocalculus aciditolerans]
MAENDDDAPAIADPDRDTDVDVDEPVNVTCPSSGCWLPPSDHVEEPVDTDENDVDALDVDRWPVHVIDPSVVSMLPPTVSVVDALGDAVPDHDPDDVVSSPSMTTTGSPFGPGPSGDAVPAMSVASVSPFPSPAADLLSHDVDVTPSNVAERFEAASKSSSAYRYVVRSLAGEP